MKLGNRAKIIITTVKVRVSALQHITSVYPNGPQHHDAEVAAVCGKLALALTPF
jgi:hypothetical protein